MAPLSSDTYREIRSWFQTNYNWIALYDSNGDEVTRINVDVDARASWTSSPTDNPLVAEIDVAGGDSDISTPVTFSASQSFRTETGDVGAGKDGFVDASLYVPADEMTLTHEVQIPPQ